MLTSELERMLRDEEHCIRVTCTSRVCIWRTPAGHGFTAPNPATVPNAPIRTLQELRVIRRLDA